MKKHYLITFCSILLYCMSLHAQKTEVQLSNNHGTDVKMGHDLVIPVINVDGDEVTVSCDSVINNVDIVIRDQFGNVMHQSTQTITPMESTIFVPDTGDGSEKCTIDLYYDRRHLSGTFKE